MHVGIEGTTPGVEWGKELSLFVEERSSPISREVWVDADNPASCYIWHPWVGPELEAIGESILCLKAV